MMFSIINGGIISTLVLQPYLLLIACIIIISLISFFHTYTRTPRVFIVDFSCYKPPASLKCSREAVLELAEKHGYSAEALSFMGRVLQGSGIGDATYLPQNIQSVVPPDLSLGAARSESEMAVFGAVDAVLAKTKVDCGEIGILIVNCTVFNAIPSLSSVIVNRYKLRKDIRCYNLTGMGCCASLLATALAKQLLQVHHNSCALVVSTENTTSGVYTGGDTSKIALNGVFRMGGSAALLSNKPSHRRHSKYELLHGVSTNTASSDLAYKCLYQEEDSEGITGITATKNLLVAATSTIEQHLQTLGLLILPLSEKLLKLWRSEAYTPRFNGCTEHFLPHVGAKPVQDAVQRKLGFEAGALEASRMTLHRFGNTSSTSIWYELAYVEAKGRVKKGDRVWQIAYGSGFKCISLISRALKDVEAAADFMNPWMSDIHQYPVELNTSASFPLPFDSPN